MDLFGDLPEPAKPDCKPVNSLFCRLPSPDTKSCDNVGENDSQPNAENEHMEKPSIGEKRKIEDDNNPVPEKKQTATGVYEVYAYCAVRQGEREEMQDAHVIEQNYMSRVPHIDPSIERLSFYAVYDGHGGARASKHAAEQLHVNLAKNFPKGKMGQIEKEMKKCLLTTYKEVDQAFLKNAAKQKPAWKDGSTATTVLVINNTVYVANLGDSKTLLVRYNENIEKSVAIPLTKDHNPSTYEERIRIQKAGGHVKDGRMMGVLEVSRSLGDGPYKRHGLSCVPDVKRCQLTPQDRYILIACDGLWKSFDNQAAIDFVDASFKECEGSDEATAWESVCNKLANEAVRRLSSDNVTVILAPISCNR